MLLLVTFGVLAYIFFVKIAPLPWITLKLLLCYSKQEKRGQSDPACDGVPGDSLRAREFA